MAYFGKTVRSSSTATSPEGAYLTSGLPWSSFLIYFKMAWLYGKLKRFVPGVLATLIMEFTGKPEATQFRSYFYVVE